MCREITSTILAIGLWILTLRIAITKAQIPLFTEMQTISLVDGTPAKLKMSMGMMNLATACSMYESWVR